MAELGLGLSVAQDGRLGKDHAPWRDRTQRPPQMLAGGVVAKPRTSAKAGCPTTTVTPHMDIKMQTGCLLIKRHPVLRNLRQIMVGDKRFELLTSSM